MWPAGISTLLFYLCAFPLPAEAQASAMGLSAGEGIGLRPSLPLGASAEAFRTSQARPWTVEDILGLSSVGGVSISPLGGWIAYVVTNRDLENNVSNPDIWVVSTDDGAPTRLAHSPKSDRAPQWSEDGSWIAFLSDRDGTSQVYGINPWGGEAWQVTEWDSGVSSFALSPDGEAIAFVASPRKSEEDEEKEKIRGRPMVLDSAYATDWAALWRAPLENGRAGESARISPDGHFVQGFVWAPDSRSFAWSARPQPALRTGAYADVYVGSAQGGEARKVTSMEGGEAPVAWVDGLGLIVSGSGYLVGTHNRQLWIVATERLGEEVSLTAGLDENAGFVAANENALLVEASFRTGRRLYRIPLAAGRPATDPQVVSDDGRFYSGFSASEDLSEIAFISETSLDPPDVFFSETASFSPRKLTDLNPQVRDLALGEQRIVQWKSRADGEDIEGVLTLPVDFREGEAVPLLLVIHGGPSGVSSNRHLGRGGAYPIPVFSGLGYAVLQPNYRGSAAYGERFRGLNRGDISGRDWVDVDSGVDHLIDAGIADPDRLGIMGWSFGGHHTYWGITQTNRYKAASAGAGANDLISMYSQTDLPAFYHTYLGPRPWEDFELYEERSAYRNVGRVTTPLLIQVGERDERVPAEQSIQFYEAVKGIGKVPTKLVIYPDQPHGVRAPTLQRDLMIRNVEWFTQWIPVGPGDPTTYEPR
jgi:dipeptidyl aminopeptidase/acylaminoacyl peptidase